MFENKNFQSWFKENTPKEGLSETTTFSKQFVKDAWDNGYYVGYNKAKEDKRRDAQDRVVRLLQKEKPNQLFNNECVRCIHTDSPCVPSDYGKDEHGYCDHFKNVFEENEELKAQNSKAKAVLRNVIDYLGQFCSDYPDCVIEAEQFLKEVKNE